MSHVKASGKVNQQSQKHRRGKRLGVKKFGGEKVISGHIILKQKGAKYKPGKGVRMGSDYTIYSVVEGLVSFGKRWGKTVVNVVS